MATTDLEIEDRQPRYWGEGIAEEDQARLDQAANNTDEIVLESPIRLGYFETFCLVVNRMVGMFSTTGRIIVFECA